MSKWSLRRGSLDYNDCGLCADIVHGTHGMTRYLLPGALFVAVVGVLALGMGRDPRLVPSPLIGKMLPVFELVQLRDPTQRVGDKDLRGKVSLLNVWATWCVSCRQEHEMLMRIARESDTPIYGLNYKDTRENALRWLDQLGDPYVVSAFDDDGKVGLNLGVYGAPETYVVDKHGTIAYKHIGRLTKVVWDDTLLPIIHALRNGGG